MNWNNIINTYFSNMKTLEEVIDIKHYKKIYGDILYFI